MKRSSPKTAPGKVKRPASASAAERSDGVRVLILAPTGNDAGLSARFLSDAGLDPRVLRNVAELCAETQAGCGAILMAEEVLGDRSIGNLMTVLAGQPAWSELPVTVISSSSEISQMQLRRLELFKKGANVILLERPFRPGTLVSTMESALRSRKRQYEVRDLLQAVWNSGERLRNYYESSHDCIKELDLKGRLLSMNQNGLRMLGCTGFEEIRLKNWPLFWKGKERKAAEEVIRHASSGKVGRFQGSCRSKGGELKWWDVILSPILDDTGRPERILAVSRDVSENRRQQESLVALKVEIEKQARIYDTTLSHINDFAYIFDRAGRFVYANQPFLDAIGRPLEEVVGKAFHELHHAPGFSSRLKRQIREVCRQKRPVRDETAYANPNGGRGYYEYILNPVIGAVGQVEMIAGSTRDITRRRAQEAELAKLAFQKDAQARLFDAFLSSMNDLAYTFDREGNWTFANKPLLKLWGRTLDEIVGKSSLELNYPPELAERLKRQVKQVVATKKPLRGETYFTDAAGVVDYHEYIFSPVFAADGSVSAVCGTTRLTTERKRAEAVAESQRRVLQLMAEDEPLRDVLEELMRTAELDCEVKACGSLLLLDDDGLRLCHVAAPSLPPDYMAAVDGMAIGPQSGSCGTAAYLKRTVIVENIGTDPLWEDCRNMALRHGLRACWSVPVLSTGGDVLGTFAMYHHEHRRPTEKDLRMAETVTRTAAIAIERKRAGEAARRLAAIVESSNDAIVSKDLNGTIMSWNRGAERLFGYTAAEIIGKPITLLLPPDQYNEEPGILRRIRAGEKIEHYQTMRRRKDGTFIDVSLTVSPIKDAGGRIIGASKIVRDITEQKQAERRLERAHQEALAASHAKDEFLAALSHELRTPLNPVLLLASEAAENPELPEGVRHQFATIRNNVELEARLIDDLLDITRITHGKLSLNREFVDVDSVLSAAVETVRADIDQKRLELVREQSEAAAVVDGDGVRLQQVFWNVLKNAVKFTPEGGRISVKTRVKEGLLEVMISDTGIGLTKTELTRVFEAFTQGEYVAASGAHRFGGLGLGLAISRKLVELHEGRITADSAGRNQGATFIITLPLSTHPVFDRSAAAKPAESRPAAEDNAQPIRVLLVEDHEPTRSALKQLLLRRNLDVVTAASLAEAREIARGETFQLLVSDIGLPDGTGYELMAELSEANRHLEGIALTGYGMEDDIANSRAAGFRVHLTKPVRIQSLENALKTVTQHLR